MDLNVIKKRLESLNKQSNSSSGGGEKKNIFWKPSVGKQVIRVVPSKHNSEIPFTEMSFYYGIGNKMMASPSNWGEKDPIMEFAKQLRQTFDKERFSLAKKLDPKVRIFVPIVVRGEESEGVKLWQFGKEVYQDFLNMAADEEIGDFTDIMDGRDIKLTTVGPDVTGTAYNKTTISPSLKSSSLSENEKEIELFLNEQPNPKEAFKKLSFEEVKKALQDWLDPDAEEETDKAAEEVLSEEKETPKPSYSATAKPAPKKTKADQFEDLFVDDEDETDLPFA
jgi:hypothetical protein